jgi:hypothetical protein
MATVTLSNKFFLGAMLLELTRLREPEVKATLGTQECDWSPTVNNGQEEENNRCDTDP